jgi:hypothetical protein
MSIHGCELVASSLHQEIKNLAFIINRPPQPELLAANDDRHPEVLGRTKARTSKTYRLTVS